MSRVRSSRRVSATALPGGIKSHYTEPAPRGKGSRSVLRRPGLLQAVLPLVDQPADVAIPEVQVRQVVPPVDCLGQFARLRRPVRQLEQEVLARRFLARGQGLQRLLEVALGQPPVMPILEAVAQVEQRPPLLPRIGPGRLQLADGLVRLP